MFSVFILSSCEKEASLEAPSLQSELDYKRWRANELMAEVTGDTLWIYGRNETLSITLQITKYSLGKKFYFGKDIKTYAYAVKKQEDDTLLEFTTSANKGSGYVEFYPAEKQVPGTITGTFVANIPNVSQKQGQQAVKDLNFYDGIFFRIPIQEKIPSSEN